MTRSLFMAFLVVARLAAGVVEQGAGVARSGLLRRGPATGAVDKVGEQVSRETMRNLTVFTVVVTLLAGGVVLCQTSTQDSQSKGTMALRSAVLSREAFKGAAPAVPGTIRAVVYDWDVGGGVATLVAFQDGTTSIYLSSGGGFIGAGAHESVKRAAAAFRDEAGRMRRHFTPAETFPLPDRGRSRFYIVTDGATLRSALFSDSEVQEEGHPLNKLARQAQDVITAVRRVSK